MSEVQFNSLTKIKMDMSSGTPFKFSPEEASTSTPKDGRIRVESSGTDGVDSGRLGSPRMIGEILDEVEEIRTVGDIRADTQDIEFEAETSSMIEHIIRIMNETEKSVIMHWDGSDPNLEDYIMEVLEGVVVQTSLFCTPDSNMVNFHKKGNLKTFT